MTGEQHENLTELIANAFSAEALHQLIRFELGTDMFVEWVATNHPHRHSVFLVLQQIDQRGLMTTFLKASIRARTDNMPFQAAIRRVWPQSDDPDTPLDVGVVTIAVNNLDQSKHSQEFRALLKSSADSLRKLSENISLLESYKELHDCLHHLQLAALRRLGVSARRLGSDAEAANDLAECIQTIQTHIAQIDAAILRLPEKPTGLRLWERDWLRRLEDTARLAGKSLESVQRTEGLQGAQMLRRILRQEPPRIDRYLRITAESIDLANLATLFGRASSLTQDPTEKIQFDAAKAETEQLSIRLKSLVMQHNHWQEIDAQLWDTEDYLPKTAVSDTSDFEAFWGMLQTQIGALTGTAPSEAWAAKLLTSSSSIEGFRVAADWPRVAGLLVELRGNAIGRFFRIDTDLKMLTREVGKIGDSLRQLLTGL